MAQIHERQKLPHVPSVQEESQKIHVLFTKAIEAGASQDFMVPPNIFAMTFSTSEETLHNLQSQRMSVVFRLEGNFVRISLIKPLQGSHSHTDFIQAQTDAGYRNSLLEGWYRSLARALQDTDEKKSVDTGREVIEDSAVPLGLVTDENGRSISIFDLAQPDLKASFQNFESMQWLARQSSIDRKGIYDYLSGLWDIIGRLDPSKQKSIQNIAPDILGSAAAGSAVHIW